MDQVRIFALGGLDENGKNMTVLEINDVIFVVEAGMKFPESDQLGVEFIIPDFQYLIDNKDRIGGIFITHAHDDVAAALPYLLKQIEISSMKEMYIKPEVRVMKFEAEGVLCGSSNGNPGGTTPDFEWDDSWPANSIW